MRGRRGPLGRPPRPKTTSLTTGRGPSSAASARVDAYDDIAGDGTARTTLRRSHRAVAQTPTAPGKGRFEHSLFEILSYCAIYFSSLYAFILSVESKQLELAPAPFTSANQLATL